jgi:hypothetical protein
MVNAISEVCLIPQLSAFLCCSKYVTSNNSYYQSDLPQVDSRTFTLKLDRDCLWAVNTNGAVPTFNETFDRLQMQMIPCVALVVCRTFYLTSCLVSFKMQ